MQNKTLIVIIISFYILISPLLANATYTGNITVTLSSVDRGTNVIIYGILPSNGSSYNYQWLYRYAPNNNPNMTGWLSANTLCSPAFGTADKNKSVQCYFLTKTTTQLGSYSFGLKVVNKTLSLQTPNSSSPGIVVYPAIEKPNTPTLSNATVDSRSGQPSIISDTLPYGGSGVFYYQWLVSYGSNTLEPVGSLPVSSVVASVFNDCYTGQILGGRGSGGISNHTVSCTLYGNGPEPPGEYHIALQVIDALDPNAVVNSSAAIITAINGMNIGNITASPLRHALYNLEPNNSILYQGQSAKFSIKLPGSFGGNPPYTYKWLTCYLSGLSQFPNSSTCSIPSFGAVPGELVNICQQPHGQVSQGETLNCTFTTNQSTPIGVYTFYLQLTDNESQSISSFGSQILVYAKTSAPSPPIINGPTLIDQYQSTTLIDAVPEYTINPSVLTNVGPNGFQPLWLYSYNGGNYSSVRFTSAPSLCANGSSNVTPINGVPQLLTSREQVKCIFSPLPMALPGVYQFKLSVQYLFTGEVTNSSPSPSIIVNPFLQMRIVNVSSNTIILGHNITITANFSISTYNFCIPTCNSNNDKQELPGTPPYTYVLRVISANNGEVVYTAFRTTPNPSFRFEINSSKLGLGTYSANVTVSDDAQIPETSSLLSTNFTILNNLNTSNIKSINSNGSVTASNILSTPPPPHNTVALSIFNVSAHNTTRSIINIIEKFPCSAKGIRPYILENGTWKPINLFTINESACTIAFSIPSDPIIGIMTNRTNANLAQLNVTLTQNHTAQNETGSVVLVANVSDGSGSYLYNWYGNSGLINTTNFRILKLQLGAAGTYEYYVIVNDTEYNISGRSNVVIVTIPAFVQENNSVSNVSVTGSTKINETIGLPNSTTSGKISVHQQWLPLMGYIFAIILIVVIVLALLRFKKVI